MDQWQLIDHMTGLINSIQQQQQQRFEERQNYQTHYDYYSPQHEYHPQNHLQDIHSYLTGDNQYNEESKRILFIFIVQNTRE